MSQLTGIISIPKRIYGKHRIIKDVQVYNRETVEANYYGWNIHIYPMWDSVKIPFTRTYHCTQNGKFGVDVRGKDGGFIVKAETETQAEALEMAVEHILSFYN